MLEQLPPQVFARNIAPYLTIADFAQLRCVCRGLQGTVDALLPIKLAWRPLLRVLQAFVGDPAASRPAVLYALESPGHRRRWRRSGNDIAVALRQLMHAACRVGDLAVVQALTEHFGLSPRQEPPDQLNSFCVACEHGQLLVAQYLAEVHRLLIFDARHMHNWPLRVVCGRGDMKLLLWLFDYFPYQARDARASANHSLRLAATNGHVNVLRLLHQRFHLQPADARMRNNEALRMACSGGHAEVVEFLLLAYDLTLEDLAAMDAATVRWAFLRQHHDVLRVLGRRFGFDVLHQLELATMVPQGVTQYLDRVLHRPPRKTLGGLRPAPLAGMRKAGGGTVGRLRGVDEVPTGEDEEEEPADERADRTAPRLDPSLSSLLQLALVQYPNVLWAATLPGTMGRGTR